MRALISVSDKTGVTELGRRLESLGWEIVSTGGTYKALKQAGVKVTEVSYVTGFPECLDGRVKTLHPKIHAGILAKRDNMEHMEFLNEYMIGTIDMVVVNLYPFKQTITNKEATFSDAIENIDIGGPVMLRAAAKNFEFVIVISDPDDYGMTLDELERDGEVGRDIRRYLAAKVFEHTAHYDALIAGYLTQKTENSAFPKTLTLTYEKHQDMRYGENPHQSAVFYSEIGAAPSGITDAIQLHGKELSFNNINDAHGAIELCREFDEPVLVACKHSNPCGVGSADNILDAYIKAYNADPVSIYGGVLVANREIDGATADEIAKIFAEIVIAPSFSEDALKVLTKKKNLRLLKLDIKRREATPDIKKVSGGVLIQGIDNTLYEPDDLKVVTKRAPDDKELEDLLFSMKVVKYAKSNAIVIGSGKQSVGIGAGQVSRIWACKQAIEHGIEFFGSERLKTSVLASDAFFPFADCVEAAAAAGIKAIMQPGGSIRDSESIEACDKYGIAMVFTGMRHFRH